MSTYPTSNPRGTTILQREQPAHDPSLERATVERGPVIPVGSEALDAVARIFGEDYSWPWDEMAEVSRERYREKARRAIAACQGTGHERVIHPPAGTFIGGADIVPPPEQVIPATDLIADLRKFIALEWPNGAPRARRLERLLDEYTTKAPTE